MRFTAFNEKPLHEQKDLQNIDYFIWKGREKLNNDLNIYQEDMSSSTKKKMMIQLEKLLKKHDYYFVYADGRAYEKGRDEQEEIERLVKEIDTSDGTKDALKLYRKYLGKNESVTNENKDKMDIHLSISGDCLKKLLGDEKEKKRTKKEKEEDDELVDVKPKIKKYESVGTLEQVVAQKFGVSTVLPETVGIEHTGSLNEIRPVGGKGTSYFNDGQLYSGFEFHRPKPKLKSMNEKHLERTSKYGKVYKNDK